MLHKKVCVHALPFMTPKILSPPCLSQMCQPVSTTDVTWWFVGGQYGVGGLNFSCVNSFGADVTRKLRHHLKLTSPKWKDLNTMMMLNFFFFLHSIQKASFTLCLYGITTKCFDTRGGLCRASRHNPLPFLVVAQGGHKTSHTASEMIFTCKLNQNIKRLSRTKMAPIIAIVLLYATKYWCGGLVDWVGATAHPRTAIPANCDLPVVFRRLENSRHWSWV